MRRWLCLMTIGGVLGVSGCGSPMLKKNIGKPGGEVPAIADENDPNYKLITFAQERWDRFAEALKIGNNRVTLTKKEEAELKGRGVTWANGLRARVAKKVAAQVAEPSGFLTDTKAYKELLGKIGARFVDSAHKGRCAAVEGFELVRSGALPEKGKLKADDDIEVYMLTYRLQADKDGTPDSQARHGFVVMPRVMEDGQELGELIVYAHDDDVGLAYDRLAHHLGPVQKDHVIVAPTYPGEPLCRGDRKKGRACDGQGELAPGVGEISPWTDDANELLGMADCIQQVTRRGRSHVKRTDATKALKKRLKELGKLKMAKLPKQPLMKLVGFSRGGLTASIAAARAGVAVKVLKESVAAADGFNVCKPMAAVLGKNYGCFPPMITGLATVSAPSSIAMGRLRLVLEHLVRGRLGETPYGEHAGLRRIEPVLKSLLEAEEITDEVLDEAVLALSTRDMILLTPLIMAAVRDWSPGLVAPAGGHRAGKVMMMHGQGDVLLPDTQTKIGFNVLYSMQASPALRGMTGSAGFDMTVRMIKPSGTFNGKKARLSKKLNFHLDDYFLTSTSAVAPDFFVRPSRQAFLIPQKLDARGKEVDDVELRDWRKQRLQQLAKTLHKKAWKDLKGQEKDAVIAYAMSGPLGEKRALHAKDGVVGDSVVSQLLHQWVHSDDKASFFAMPPAEDTPED